MGLLAYVRVLTPWLGLRRPYVVEEVRRERGDTWTLVLRPDGHAGMTFHPGQFAWLALRSLPFADREHPFSFSSSAARPEHREFTIKEDRMRQRLSTALAIGIGALIVALKLSWKWR